MTDLKQEAERLAQEIHDAGWSDNFEPLPNLKAGLLSAMSLALEAAAEALWERVGREEYGHAKAAVTLDIEAIRALARSLAEEPAPGQHTQGGAGE